MGTELVPGRRFSTRHIPLKAPNHRAQVSFEHGPNVGPVREPTDSGWQVLQQVRIDGDPQHAPKVIHGPDPPRHEGRLSAALTDLEVIADPVDPAAEAASVRATL